MLKQLCRFCGRPRSAHGADGNARVDIPHPHFFHTRRGARSRAPRPVRPTAASDKPSVAHTPATEGEDIFGGAPVNPDAPTRRILVGTPTLGTVRIEWHNAMAGIVIPCNWSNSANTPINYLVADAQNIIAHEAIRGLFDWVLFLEDDVLPPPDLFLRLEAHMQRKTEPIVSGLYHLKGPRSTPEPLVYRGRGTGAFKAFKAGELVYADGVPTGCLLVHTSVLLELSAASPVYQLRAGGTTQSLKRIFETPREAFLDQGTGAYSKVMGTSDLFFCDRVIREGILKKAGWAKAAARRYPFVVDTGIRCGHIDRVTGLVY